MGERIHYRRPGRNTGYRCGIGKRWPSQIITSTAVRTAVTCLSCRRLLALSARSEIAR